MKFILIIWIVGNATGISMVSAEFNNKNSCEQAGNEWLNNCSILDSKFICIEKGIINENEQ